MLDIILLFFIFIYIVWLTYFKINNVILFKGICVIYISITFLLFYLCYLYLTSFFVYYVVLLNSYSVQDILYKIFSVWCTHEGSILLWIWCFLTYLFYTNITFYINSLFFIKGYLFIILLLLFYLISFSNPFLLLEFFSVDGIELTTLLHNPLVSIHPPILYIGYLITSIVFIYILSSILTLSFFNWFNNFYLYIIIFIGFIFLSLGILLGSFWAYNELGWGGWWYWDAIENLALLPWLVFILGLHLFKISLRLNFVYINGFIINLYSFLFLFLGTFFLRSGNLDSIHNFVIEHSRGFILILFVLFFLLLSTLLVGIIFKYFLFFYKINTNLLYTYFIFFLVFFLYIISIYWGTFYPFFYKIIFSNSLILSNNYFNLVSLLFSCFILLLLSFIFFKYIIIFLIIFSILYYFTLSINIFIYFFLYLSLFILYLLVYNRFIVNYFLHITLAFIIIWVFVISLFDYTFLFSIKPFYCLYLINNYSFICGDWILFQNDYFTSSYLPIYLYFKDTPIFTLYLEKTFFFNSSNFRTIVDIGSSLFFDSFVLLEKGNNFDGWYLQFSYKTGMIVFWLLFFILFVFSIFLFFKFFKYQKYYFTYLF